MMILIILMYFMIDITYFEHFQKIALTEQQKYEMKLQSSESSEGEAEVEKRVSR